MHSMSPVRSLVLLALAGASIDAFALEPYVATGFPYALVGVAQALNGSVTLRADFGTVAHHNFNGNTSDQDYRGSIDYSRAALLADWFALGNGFRLTGGATFNQAKATLRATAHDGQIVLGDTVFQVTGSQYYVESEVKMPDVMPYLGIGWGHHAPANGAGFTFNFDIGASIGAAKATPLTPSAQLASEITLTPGGTDALATENRRFQDDVASVKALPQVTIGVGYRF